MIKISGEINFENISMFCCTRKKKNITVINKLLEILYFGLFKMADISMELFIVFIDGNINFINSTSFG